MRLALPFLFIMCALTAFAADTPNAEEKAAIDYVLKSEGTATLDPHLPSEARVLAKFDTVTDAVLIGMKKYPQIGGVDAFDATKCTFKGFGALKDLPHLHKLVLGKAEIAVTGASTIGQCKELRHLGLMNAGLTDTSLAGLKKLTLLEHLTVSGNPKITDKGMATVKSFERLRVLDLGNTSITDDGLKELKSLDGLRKLSVAGTKVTADVADKFADDMPNLRSVRR